MADSEVRVPEVVYELDAKVYHGKMSVPDALEQAYSAGMRAGEIAMREKAVNLLEAETYHSAYAAEIQSAIRALPAAPEEKKP